MSTFSKVRRALTREGRDSSARVCWQIFAIAISYFVFVTALIIVGRLLAAARALL